MEVAIIGADLAHRAVIYVSNDCMSDYDLEQTKLPKLNPNREAYTRQKRAIVEMSPKCLGWEDVILNSSSKK